MKFLQNRNQNQNQNRTNKEKKAPIHRSRNTRTTSGADNVQSSWLSAAVNATITSK